MQETMGEEDLRKDVVALRPTPQELQFVRGELPRLGRIDQPRAARIESFLDQHHDDGP